MKFSQNLRRRMVVAFLIFLILGLAVWVGTVYLRSLQKTVAIFGSISKEITHDEGFNKELDLFISNINTSKYKYIAPNTRSSAIGYILDHVQEKDKQSFTTTYVTSFNSATNASYPIRTFPDAIEYEQYMITHSNVFVFLPGGVGTLYEISFVLLLIDLNDTHTEKVIFYNRNNYFNFVKELMDRFNKTGYLREAVYQRFLNKTHFASTMQEVVGLL